MINPFERHGIGHLSPSSLNLFIAQPGIWALRYLGRQKDAGGPAMWRGTAVEAGFAAALTTRTNWCEVSIELFDTWLEGAARAFWLNVAENNARGEAADKEAELLEPMLKQCLMWQPPSELMAMQIKVEHWFDDVPVSIIGYVDLAFEGIDVDLKTTMRCPSKPTPAHVRQVALYRAARGRAGGLLYVTDKRYAYFDVTDEMRDEALADLANAARKITKLLTAFDKPEDVMEVLPIDWDDFRAPKQRVLRTASALDDFTAVELET